MKEPRSEPRVSWEPAAHLEGVQLMSVREWQSDLTVYHEAVDFCLMGDLAGTSGPKNFYRHWAYTAAPGDVLLFEPGNAHHAQGGPMASFRVLSVPEPLLRRAKEELTGKASELHLAVPVSSHAYLPFDRLMQLLSQGATQLDVQEAFALALGWVIAKCAEPERVERPDPLVVARAREFIQQCARDRLHRNVSLDEVVAVSGAAGKFNLCRSFRSSMHVGVCAYFKLLRLARGKKLLLEQPDRSIKHIAWDLGYTLSSFSRAFAEQYGVSPRQYRSAMRLRA